MADGRSACLGHPSSHLMITTKHTDARTVLEPESWVGGLCFLKDATNL
uniref:Uncharacterized protein n=1 Tax=Arundo donax TaxID=35708 RepID=A0A0A9HHH5_ARUDO